MTDEPALSAERLTPYARCLVDFLAELALDPHLGFQTYLRKRLAAASRPAELAALLGDLLAWSDALITTEAERKRLEKYFENKNLPDLSEVRSALGAGPAR